MILKKKVKKWLLKFKPGRKYIITAFPNEEYIVLTKPIYTIDVWEIEVENIEKSHEWHVIYCKDSHYPNTNFLKDHIKFIE